MQEYAKVRKPIIAYAKHMQMFAKVFKVFLVCINTREVIGKYRESTWTV